MSKKKTIEILIRCLDEDALDSDCFGIIRPFEDSLGIYACSKTEETIQELTADSFVKLFIQECDRATYKLKIDRSLLDRYIRPNFDRFGDLRKKPETNKSDRSLKNARMNYHSLQRLRLKNKFKRGFVAAGLSSIALTGLFVFANTIGGNLNLDPAFQYLMKGKK